MATKKTVFHCDSCGRNLVHQDPHTTGYGIDSDGLRHCFQCCGHEDREYMIEHGRITLYLTTAAARGSRGATVTNWPGTLRFSGGYKVGRHNIAGTRFDVWFPGPDGYVWHGVQYGHNTQLCHCKRTRELVSN